MERADLSIYIYGLLCITPPLALVQQRHKRNAVQTHEKEDTSDDIRFGASRPDSPTPPLSDATSLSLVGLLDCQQAGVFVPYAYAKRVEHPEYPRTVCSKGRGEECWCGKQGKVGQERRWGVGEDFFPSTAY